MGHLSGLHSVFPQIRSEIGSWNSCSVFKINRARGWHSVRDSSLPPRFPFIDSARGNPELQGQFWARTGKTDGLGNGVSFHGLKSGTISSACQAPSVADSSTHFVHDSVMDIKEDFGRRLIAALDHAKVSTRTIDRKRYLAHIAGVTERHAGNYLSGEKMPTTEGMIDLAIRLGVSWEWLATGRGSMLSVGLTPEETSTIQALSTKDRERLFQIGQVLAHPKSGEQSAPIAA